MKIEIPKVCPSCQSLVTRIKDQIYCSSDSCEAVGAKKVQKFCTALGVKGFGPATIEKLKLNSIDALLKLKQEDLEELMGARTAENLGTALLALSVGVPFNKLIEAYSIKYIGPAAAEKIASVASSFEEVDEETLRTAGLGPVAIQSFLNWYNTNEWKSHNIPTIESNPGQPELTSDYFTVCISGKLGNGLKKKEAQIELIGYGSKLIDKVTKSVNYLINDDGKNSAKVTKAKAMNIPVVTWDEFTKLAKEKLRGNYE